MLAPRLNMLSLVLGLDRCYFCVAIYLIGQVVNSREGGSVAYVSIFVVFCYKN